MSLECTAGADKIAILSQGNGWMEIQGVAVSDGIGDVEFRLVSEIDGVSYTNTACLTVACVTNLSMTCDYAGTSPNPPPFDGETACPFSVTNSLAPDRHLVVPFCNVATLGDDGFSVTNFAVQMSLVLAPSGVNGSSLPCDWEVVEAKPQMSGSLSHEGGLEAWFVNPVQGGVYRFRGRCDGCPWTEGNVVLPLSGAGVEGVVEGDLADLQLWVWHLNETVGAVERQVPWWGLENFFDFGMGDYRGRVDNAWSPTVWTYNGVNDDSGKGAVATLFGVPTRMAKLSNLMVAYTTESIGVLGVLQRIAQTKGTWRDPDGSGAASWEAGVELAGGAALSETLSGMATNIWSSASSGDKAKALWPNTPGADNHSSTTNSVDYNLFFRSPGIVERGRMTAE